MVDFLSELNESQRQAVEYNDGPSLVIAGAGSGKTRVLTYKIAYLIEQGFRPNTLLALTFTNKAASEMKERIAAIVGSDTAKRLWMGTFHSIFSRILRVESRWIGYNSSFTIYDASDSKSMIKSIIKELGLDDKKYKPSVVCGAISHAKNSLITPDLYALNRTLMQYDYNAGMPKMLQVYEIYVQRCKLAQVMDFDDLLVNTNILFRDFPEVLAKYRDYFSYILVDEYQDTNFAQHLIVKRLVEGHQCFCVVGDDAQSIYSFRGANIENILSFQRDYPKGRLFKLEQNYRSTQTIVNAANSLIKKNEVQIPKDTFSKNNVGNPLQVIKSFSDMEEGIVVARMIARMMSSASFEFSDFAILYRTNAQSRIFEECFRKAMIPYRIYGGLSFYQRKEIKDIVAYFRLMINPYDEEALKRIINYPTRGIGDTTVGKIMNAAVIAGVSLWEVLNETERFGIVFNKGTKGRLAAFVDMMHLFVENQKLMSSYELAVNIIEQSGIKQDIFGTQTPEYATKQENIEELLSAIMDFSQGKLEEGEVDQLSDFLAEISLLSDNEDEEDAKESKVTMMTIHSAKGLEFSNVFVVGLEEGLFPSRMSQDSQKAIEEERRLFYVAITRAKENCVLSHVRSRFRNGNMEICSPSRFLKEIDPKFLMVEGAKEKTGMPIKEVASLAKNVSESKPLVPLLKETVTSTQPPIGVSTFSGGNRFSLQYNIGVDDVIIHERFGRGVVLELEGEGDNCKAKVEFENAGIKHLLLKFARFEKI